ncbi:putative disease resistance protein RGA4 [Panicum miliaceum]|uniref:Disease resistance protein RGA4 n=1 Tax=Panicum miliaceum TaxID=4540 RepID=A0A3L6PVK3_PANMI|nr:putative disease resistance protein RGA4 [Panicum miliaceum]
MSAPKLEFARVNISKRMKDIVDELKPLCTKVSTILNLDLLDSNRSIVQDIAASLLKKRGHVPIFHPTNIHKSRPMTTSEISEPKLYGRQKVTTKIIHDITEGDYSANYLTVLPIAGLGDYGFDREELIHWWIGLDILHSDGQNKSTEDKGSQCLKELVDHGFFKEDKIYGSPCYIVHDLLHDLGRKVASRECLNIGHANMGSVEIWPSVRHLSINVDGAEDSDGITTRNFISELRIRKKKLKIKNLQTLMIFGEWDESFTDFLSGLIREANGLRVLHVSKMLPDMEFSSLHLRYLSLGMIDCWKIRLPNMLSRLYLLRILNLE